MEDSMCDMDEAEWPEYLLQVEAAALRARIRVSRPPSVRTLEKPVEPALVAVEASA
jgi:hypothetical protein